MPCLRNVRSLETEVPDCERIGAASRESDGCLKEQTAMKPSNRLERSASPALEHIAMMLGALVVMAGLARLPRAVPLQPTQVANLAATPAPAVCVAAGDGADIAAAAIADMRLHD
jgi:hypothetical protein